MFTQIIDNKCIKLFKNCKMYAICTKCTPKRTLIMFFISALTIKMKKKSENVYPCVFLYDLISLHYIKIEINKSAFLNSSASTTRVRQAQLPRCSLFPIIIPKFTNVSLRVQVSNFKSPNEPNMAVFLLLV